MSSTFIENPKEYWTKGRFGDRHQTFSFIQFVPGVVVSVVTGEDSVGFAGNYRNLGSIIASPHIKNNKGLNKKSMLGEEFRHYPLLRGMQETPVPGDPVLLCEFAGSKYYLGPLNTFGHVNFNTDRIASDEINIGVESGPNDVDTSGTPLFIRQNIRRLEKRLNPALDSPVEWKIYEDLLKSDPEAKPPIISNTIHGDIVLEGRHGNSLRIGSRNINPYMIISNGRNPDNPVETILDGTLVGIFSRGSIRKHFNNEWIDQGPGKPLLKNEFTLADETIPEPLHTIKSTFHSSMGRGLGPKKDTIPGATGVDDDDIDNTIYGYNNDQLLITSNRVTINSKSESMFLASKQFMHFGSGNNITFSTSKTFLVNAAQSMVANTGKLFQVKAEDVYINGTQNIVPQNKPDGSPYPNAGDFKPAIHLGDPLMGDMMQRAVLGQGLSGWLVQLVNAIQDLAWSTSEAIENSKKEGGSVEIMGERVKAFEALLGLEIDENTGNPIPKKMEDLILSNKVEISR